VEGVSFPMRHAAGRASRRAPVAQEGDRELHGLIERIAGGDEAALAELYDATSRQVYGLALRVLGDPSAAEDVTLEVFTQVWRTASSYDMGRGTPFGWLLTMTRSRAIDRIRSDAQARKREEPLEFVEGTEGDPGPSPEANVAEAERRRIVRDALAVLSPEQRQVVELAYFGGLSHSEIAAELNQPIGTVKTRIRLAMQRLRDALSGLKRELI
jgi:RNA polymerase sigma-70 factor (ECF subfamily)